MTRSSLDTLSGTWRVLGRWCPRSCMTWPCRAAGSRTADLNQGEGRELEGQGLVLRRGQHWGGEEQEEAAPATRMTPASLNSSDMTRNTGRGWLCPSKAAPATRMTPASLNSS